MSNEITTQDNFPKDLDPWLGEMLGKIVHSQLIGEDYEKRCSTRTFMYEDVKLVPDNAMNFVRRVLLESKFKTLAMNNGNLRIIMILSKDMIALEGDKEVARTKAGEPFTFFNIETP